MASLSFWFDARPSGSATVYAYLYTHAEPGPNAARYGAFHSSELAYMFDTLDAAARPFTAQDHDIADKIAAYRANFVRSGNPNGDGLPQRPQFEGRTVMELGDHFAPRSALSAETREAFRAFLAKGGELGTR
jgi:para-nitrobenzyl esterase